MAILKWLKSLFKCEEKNERGCCGGDRSEKVSVVAPQIPVVTKEKKEEKKEEKKT